MIIIIIILYSMKLTLNYFFNLADELLNGFDLWYRIFVTVWPLEQSILFYINIYSVKYTIRNQFLEFIFKQLSQSFRKKTNFTRMKIPARYSRHKITAVFLRSSIETMLCRTLPIVNQMEHSSLMWEIIHCTQFH